jgi:hypothetical protein
MGEHEYPETIELIAECKRLRQDVLRQLEGMRRIRASDTVDLERGLMVVDVHFGED